MPANRPSPIEDCAEAFSAMATPSARNNCDAREFMEGSLVVAFGIGARDLAVRAESHVELGRVSVEVLVGIDPQRTSRSRIARHVVRTPGEIANLLLREAGVDLRKAIALRIERFLHGCASTQGGGDADGQHEFRKRRVHRSAPSGMCKLRFGTAPVPSPLPAGG